MTQTATRLAWADRLRAFVIQWRWPILILGALLFGLTVILPQIGLVEWVALIPAALVFLTMAADPAVRLRRLYGMGFVFMLFFLAVTYHWFFYMYPLDFADMSRPASAVVVSVACFGLSGFQAVGAALLFPLLGFCVRGRWLSKHTVLHPLLLAALWTALEWWWSHSGWSGVPWSRLAVGQAELLPTMQIAYFLGSYAVSFLILTVNGYLAYLLLHPDRRVLCLSLAGGLFFGNLGVGALRLSTYEPGDRTLTVASIQGNKSSLDYWSFDSIDEVLDIYTNLTREAVDAGAELVVWPETCIPVNIDTSPNTRRRLQSLAVECEVPILVGVFTQVEEGSTVNYNSIVAILPDGTRYEPAYNKRNPVPFGEFVPFRSVIATLIPPLTEINTLDEDIPAGAESVVFDLDVGAVGPIICFDSIYEDNILDSVRNGAELITISTNDSWFKDSRGVWMHHAQAQLRAIESGRCIVRSANTGVSSVIDASGRIVGVLDALETGYVLETVTLRTETTPYMVIGNLFCYLCLAAVAAGILPAGWDLICRRKQTKD